MDQSTASYATVKEPATGPTGLSGTWLMVLGTLLIILGCMAMASMFAATIVSVYFVGVGMLVAGAAQIGLAFRSKSTIAVLGWITMGVLYACAGAVAILDPLVAAGVLTLLLGASLLVSAMARLVLSLRMKAASGWMWVSLSAVVTGLLGLAILVQWPLSSLYMLGMFLSIDLLLAGATWVALGLSLLTLNRHSAAVPA